MNSSSHKAWRLPLTLTNGRPPLSLNGRDHWATRARIVKTIRREAHARAHAAKLPTGLAHIHTQLVWLTPNRRRRDDDNIIATAKPAWDGLTDYGLVPDDDPTHMTKHMPRIIPHPHPGHTRLDLWVWTGDHTPTPPETIIQEWSTQP